MLAFSKTDVLLDHPVTVSVGGGGTGNKGQRRHTEEGAGRQDKEEKAEEVKTDKEPGERNDEESNPEAEQEKDDAEGSRSLNRALLVWTGCTNAAFLEHSICH